MEEAQRKAAFTYNAASDSYDSPALGFWNYFGQRTIDRLGLAAGAKVLDVCCGAGGSAIPAARAVGASGEVTGVDLAKQLLPLAQSKAAGLPNIRFQIGDMLALNFPDESFDAVVCVFGIFFVPDMPAAVRELWRVLKPGGKLAITTWGPDLFEPANSIFWQVIAEVRPDLHKRFNPWERVDNPRELTATLSAAGVTSAETEAEERLHPLPTPEDWWMIVLGSGYRGTIEQLTESERDKVEETNLVRVREANISTVQTNALYGVAVKHQ